MAAGAGKEQGHGEGDTSGGGENPVEGMSAVKPSEAPAAAGPGSASPAAEEAERLDLCPEEEEPPDCAEEGELPTAFEVTREVADALAAVLADHAPGTASARLRFLAAIPEEGASEEEDDSPLREVADGAPLGTRPDPWEEGTRGIPHQSTRARSWCQCHMPALS